MSGHISISCRIESVLADAHHRGLVVQRSDSARIPGAPEQHRHGDLPCPGGYSKVPVVIVVIVIIIIVIVIVIIIVIIIIIIIE